ncbi:unnamed protein product [Phyllotreta striolata]|uniref:Uncharacterized protein n=1 Tax=Phyllotreta striolata TaxID=444603 RepID=A0A9N9XN06_PHYSR|nr:unnamed protein product [Phyllotreta striolata]
MEEVLQDPEVSKVFHDNEITIDLLSSVTDEILQELIPLVGPRLRIKKRIASYLNSQKENIENQLPELPENEASSHSTATSLSEIDFLSETSFDSYFGDNIDKILYRPKFVDFDLKTILLTTPMGNSILKFYEVNNMLDNTRRGRLVDIIVKHLYKHIINYRFNHDEYTILSAKIIQLFPTEVTATYYVQSIAKRNSASGKHVLAKGRLVDKCRNLIFNCGEAVPLKRKRKAAESSSSDTPEGSSSTGR